MSVACSVLANLTAAHDQPYMSACFVEKGRTFESGLACPNQCDVAPGKSRQIMDLGAVVTQWLGKARQLLWDHAERHVPRGQDDTLRLKGRCSRKIKQEARTGAAHVGDSHVDGFADSSLAKPFRITEKVRQAKRVAGRLIRNPVLCQVTFQRELPIRVPKIRGKSLRLQDHPHGHELTPALKGCPIKVIWNARCF